MVVTHVSSCTQSSWRRMIISITVGPVCIDIVSFTTSPEPVVEVIRFKTRSCVQTEVVVERRVHGITNLSCSETTSLGDMRPINIMSCRTDFTTRRCRDAWFSCRGRWGHSTCERRWRSRSTTWLRLRNPAITPALPVLWRCYWRSSSDGRLVSWPLDNTSTCQ